MAELIEVPKEYTLAIETALGGAAQHIVVENEKDGRAGIPSKTTTQWPGNLLPLTTLSRALYRRWFRIVWLVHRASWGLPVN